LSKPPGNPLACLEISDDEIRLAMATQSDSGYVVDCRRHPLPASAVVSGDAVDTDAVVAALRELLGATSPRPRRVALVLGGKQIVCRVESVASGQGTDAMAACQERMRRYLAFGSKPIFLACAFGSASGDGDGPAWLLSAAAPRELVLRQVEVAKRCGLKVVRAEPAMVALTSALPRLKPDGHARFLLVAGNANCEIGLLQQNGLTFCVQLPVRADALPQEGDRLVAMLERITDYHFRHARGKEPVEELLCCGPAGELDGLFGQLSDAGIRAGWIDPLEFAGVERLDGDDGATPAERAATAAVAAAALARAEEAPGSQGLDLLPPPERKSGLTLLPVWLVVPALLTLLVTCGLMTWGSLTDRRAARLTHVLNNPTPAMLECTRLQLREDQLKRQAEDIRLMVNTAPNFAKSELLAELPKRLPKDLWLERVEFGIDGRGNIEGAAQTEDAVFAFADGLRRSPYVEAARISRSGADRKGERVLSRFRIEVDLATAAESSKEGGSHE
jgi:hypothetical protein